MSLESLRAAVLAEAAAEADRLLAEADREAAAGVALAEREAAARLEGARAEGRAAAELEAARERRRARLRVHALLLRAQGEVYEELRRGATSAALALREQSGYPALLERLAGAAREQLGEQVELELDPPGVGGVVARADSRSVDYTLPALADRCLVRLGPDLEQLWR